MGKDLKGKDLGVGLSQRKDGIYCARAKIGTTKICIYNSNISKLKKEFEEKKALAHRDEYGERPGIKLVEWFEEWFERCKAPSLKSDVSRKVYYRKINNTYINVIGTKKVEDISQMNIQIATNELVEKEYSYRSIKEALGALKECLDIAVVNKVIKVNPCVGINILNANVTAAKEKRVLSDWELKLFLEEIENNYYYEAYMFLLLTGVRIGEFSGLRWGDIDFGNKVITIERSMRTYYDGGKKVEELCTPKTSNAYRRIPFFGDVEKYLLAWRKKQQALKEELGGRWRANPDHGDLVFTTTMGSPATRYPIAHDLKRVRENMQAKENYNANKEGRVPREIKNIHPHVCRHTFATLCFKKGLEPLFVQQVMGHSSYSTTLHYTHITDSYTNSEVAKAGSLL